MESACLAEPGSHLDLLAVNGHRTRLQGSPRQVQSKRANVPCLESKAGFRFLRVYDRLLVMAIETHERDPVTSRIFESVGDKIDSCRVLLATFGDKWGVSFL